MAEWRDAQLSELIDIKHGFAFKGEFFTDEPTGDILVTPGNFAIGGGFQLNKPKFYNGPVPKEYVLNPGDVIVTMTDLSKQADTLGYSAVVPSIKPRLLHNQRIGRVIAKDASANLGFIAWLMRTRPYRHEIVGGATGSTVKHTSPGRILAHRFKLPSPKEQQDIVDVLQPLDDKIELNRRMNETLEGMAQAIFRDWFVDFGPVRRVQAGEADPVAIMGGLTPDPARAADLAALFPASIGNDGLPVGWSDGTLARLALVNSESWKASNHPAEVEYVDLSNTKLGTIEATTRLEWGLAPIRARRIARIGDSIIGTVRPGNGSYAYIGQDGFTVSTGFAVLRPKQAIYTDAIYVAATAADNITRLANLADGHGGAYPAVNPDVVAATPFPVVPDALLTAFSTFASPLREKNEQAKLENATLAETRDYLLPRLMSGAVRVAPTAEAA